MSVKAVIIEVDTAVKAENGSGRYFETAAVWFAPTLKMLFNFGAENQMANEPVSRGLRAENWSSADRLNKHCGRKMRNTSEQFLRLFSDPAPALRIKFSPSDEQAKTVRVHHSLGPQPDAASRKYLEALLPHQNLSEFCEFYQKHDGAELCTTFDARCGRDRPLLELKPAKSIAAFTNRYTPTGDRSWIIDLNKSKALYRGAASWIVFAEIDGGPMCLTTFLDGENAGFIFFAAPQPPFNILRPIARGFQPLIHRIVCDLPAFLRLVRATVCLRGDDGENYGFSPVEYLSNAEDKVGGAH